MTAIAQNDDMMNMVHMELHACAWWPCGYLWACGATLSYRTCTRRQQPAQAEMNTLQPQPKLTSMNKGEHSESLGGLYGGGRVPGLLRMSPFMSKINMSAGRMRSFCTPEGAMTKQLDPLPSLLDRIEIPPPVPDTHPWS